MVSYFVTEKKLDEIKFNKQKKASTAVIASPLGLSNLGLSIIALFKMHVITTHNYSQVWSKDSKMSTV